MRFIQDPAWEILQNHWFFPLELKNKYFSNHQVQKGIAVFVCLKKKPWDLLFGGEIVAYWGVKFN